MNATDAAAAPTAAPSAAPTAADITLDAAYFDSVPQDGHFTREVVVLGVHGLHLLAHLQTRVLHGSNPQLLLQLPHQHRLFL